MSRSVNDLMKRVEADPDLEAELRDDPVAVLQREAAFREDPQFYRIAIAGLVGIIVLIVILSVIVQLAKGEEISDWISALATTALGGLVGLFAPSPAAGD